MTTPFKTTVDLIQDGKPVDAATTNKPISDLTQRTVHLKERLDALEAGQLLRVDGVALQGGMLVGTPSFIDTDNVAKPAIADLSDDVVGGLAAKTAFFVGVLLEKESNTLGSLALHGRIVRLTNAQWAAVIDTAVATPGHYWLSGTDAGKLSLLPGALAIYVGQLLPDDSFILSGQAPSYGEHTHYQFDLIGAPAGTVVDPAIGNPHVVTVPNAALQGWLPAAAPHFIVSTIPAGAKFGYNLAHANEADLRSVFPPLPLEGVAFSQGGILLDDGRVLVNQYGVWWMDDTYGNAPWPTDYSVSLTADEVRFWFSRLIFSTAQGLVQNLGKHPQSVLDIEVLSPAGQPATGGRLLLRVLDVVPNDGDDSEGELAVKEIVDGKHKRGPIINRMLPGPGIAIAASHGDATAGFYGTLIVTAADSDALQGNADIADLQNAMRESLDGVQVVTLKSTRAANPIFTFNLSRLAPALSNLVLKPWLTSNVSGTLAASTTVEYRILTPSATGAALPSAWSLLGNLGGTAVVANQAKELTLPAITNVPAGSQVLVRINRANADGFNGHVSLIRLGFLLA